MLNKEVKEKDKIIHDLKKENGTVSENLLEIKSQFANLRAEVNREKK